MFNLDKFIKMVRNGKISSKPFNIRKKAVEMDADAIIDQMDAEEKVRKQQEAAAAAAQSALNLTPQQIQEQNIQKTKIQNEMDMWVTQQADNMKKEIQIGKFEEHKQEPEKSLLKSDKFITEEIMRNEQLKGDLSAKIESAIGVGSYIADIFVDTLMAKYKVERDNINNAPVEVPTAVPVKDPVEVTEEDPEEDPEEFGEVGYDKITGAVSEKFTPAVKSQADRDRVSKFQMAVNLAFGAPKSGSQFDQRMKFFLVNSHLLKEPYFPKEFPQKNIFQQLPGLEGILTEQLAELGINTPDVTAGLKASIGWTRVKARSNRSPKSIMSNLLKENAESELHEILYQLIEKEDDLIPKWINTKIKHVDKMYGASIFNNPEITDVRKGKDPAVMPKATDDQRQRAIDKNTAIVETYLKSQVEIMDHMKDETMSSLMSFEYNKYNKLKQRYAQAQGGEKRKIKAQMKAQMKLYTDSEYLTAFGNYALDTMEEFFDDATAVVSGKMVQEQGAEETGSQLNYTGKYGRAKVLPADIERIFAASKDIKDKELNNNDYIEEYIRQINEGIVTDPYIHNFSELANRSVQYDSFADLFILKSEIKSKYNEKIDPRSPDSRSGVDAIDSILGDIVIHGFTNKMLEDFSGVSKADKPSEKVAKQKAFIEMTLAQTDNDLKTFKNCYDARKKYSDQRDEVDPNLPDADYKKKISVINRAEAEGDIVEGKYALDKKGRKIPVRAPGCVLKNIKQNIKRRAYLLFPSILESLKKPRTDRNDIFSNITRKEFINIFAKDDKQYEQFAAKGKKVNPSDPEGRTNTELYWEIVDGKVPEDIQKAINFSRSRKESKDELTENEQKYITNLNFIFGRKKKLREYELSLLKNKTLLDNHIKNTLNFKAQKDIDEILDQPNIDAQYRMMAKLEVPPENMDRLLKRILNRRSTSKPLRDKYNIWLRRGGNVKRKNTIKRDINDLQANVDETTSEIQNLEMLNEKVRQQAEVYAKSYLRMVTAEYNKALLKIDKLHKIRKSSYKFASVDYGSIDDTILGIEKDFENLLDGLIG